MHFLFPKSQTHSVCLSGPNPPPFPLPAAPTPLSVFIGVEARRDHSSSINKLAWASSEPTEAQSFHRPFTWSRLAGRLEAASEASAGEWGGVALLRKGGSTWWGGKEMFGLIINRGDSVFFCASPKGDGSERGKKNNKRRHAAFRVPFFPRSLPNTGPFLAFIGERCRSRFPIKLVPKWESEPGDWAVESVQGD